MTSQCQWAVVLEFAVAEFAENPDPHKDLSLEDGDRHESYNDQDR